MDAYADNKGIIAYGMPGIEEYTKEVSPNRREIESFRNGSVPCLNCYKFLK